MNEMEKFSGDKNQNQPERPENLESNATPESNDELIENIKTGMEKDVADLSPENGEKMIAESADSIEVDPEAQQKELEKNGIFEKLEEISKKIKKAVAIGTAALTFAGVPGNFKEVSAMETNADENLLAAKVENNQENYDGLMKEVRKYAIGKDYETLFCIAKGKDIKFIKEIDQKKASGHIGFEKITDLLEENSEMEIIHTHPAFLTGFSQKEINEIELGKTESILMPPSFLDIMALTAEENFFEKDFKKIKNKVVDPFGSWEYGYEKNNKFSLLLQKFNRSFLMGDVIEKGEFSDEEKKIFKDELKQKFNGINPDFQNAFLFDKIIYTYGTTNSNFNLLESFNKKISGIVQEKIKKLKSEFPEEFSDLEEIISNELMCDVANFNSETTQQNVKRNMEIYKKNGIILEYKPFKK